MTDGAREKCRIEVIGGPWPERIGSRGYTVPDPGDGVYPFDKRSKAERIIKLDSDPLGMTTRGWTCAIGVRYLRFLADD